MDPTPSGLWCDGCGGEFIVGVDRCPSCDRSLVATPPQAEPRVVSAVVRLLATIGLMLLGALLTLVALALGYSWLLALAARPRLRDAIWVGLWGAATLVALGSAAGLFRAGLDFGVPKSQRSTRFSWTAAIVALLLLGASVAYVIVRPR